MDKDKVRERGEDREEFEKCQPKETPLTWEGKGVPEGTDDTGDEGGRVGASQ